MTGLKTKRIIWTVVFLSITLAAIVMECVAGLLHPAGTIPWTEYLARYVPWPIQLIAYVALATWLPFHFWRHDHMRKVAYDRGVRLGQRMALNAAAEMLDVQAQSHAAADLRPGLRAAARWVAANAASADGH